MPYSYVNLKVNQVSYTPTLDLKFPVNPLNTELNPICQ